MAAVEAEVAVRMLWRVGYQQQLRPRARRDREPGEIKVGEHVRIDDQEGAWSEPGQCAKDAATGLERLRAFLAVADRQAEAAAVAERGANLLTEPGKIDDHLAHPGMREPFEVMHDQRLAAGHQQGLGYPVGQRAHALAAAGSKQHGVSHAHAGASASARTLAGPSAGSRRRSSQCAKAASSG